MRSKQHKKQDIRTFWLKATFSTYFPVSTLSSISYHAYFLTAVFWIKCFTRQERYYMSSPEHIIWPTLTEQLPTHGITEEKPKFSVVKIRGSKLQVYTNVTHLPDYQYLMNGISPYSRDSWFSFISNFPLFFNNRTTKY